MLYCKAEDENLGIFSTHRIIRTIEIHLSNIDWVHSALILDSPMPVEVDGVLKNQSYFATRLLNDDAPYRKLYNLSSSVRVLDPRYLIPEAAEMVPNADLVFLVATFYRASERAVVELRLRTELVQYRTIVSNRPVAEASSSESPNMPLVLWWKHPECAERIPSWRELFVKVATVQPSSCSVERLFSVAKHVLSPCKTLSLPDLIRYSVIRYYNKDFYFPINFLIFYIFFKK